MPTLILNDDEIAALNEPIAGQGGFQTLLARLQNELRPTGELELSDEDIETIRYYRCEYGAGGWQRRLDRIFGRTLGPFE